MSIHSLDGHVLRFVFAGWIGPIPSSTVLRGPNVRFRAIRLEIIRINVRNRISGLRVRC